MVLLANALLFATRRMMNSGAITCPVRRHISQPVRRSGLWEGTNLSLKEDEHEESRGSDYGG